MTATTRESDEGLDGRLWTVQDHVQAWHLSRLATLREIQAALSGIDPQSFAEGDWDRLQGMLQAGIEEAWTSYVRQVTRHPEDQRDFFAFGQPDQIELDPEQRTIVVHWKASHPYLQNPFGELRLSFQDGPAFHISDPFKPIDLASLPEGTFQAPLQDSRHGAVAAMHQLVALVHRDMSRLMNEHPPAEVWKAMRNLARFLQAGANVSLHHLQRDHYRDWDTNLGMPTCFLDAPSHIDRKAATTAAQQRIALHYTAALFSELLSKVMDLFQDDDERRVQVVLEELALAETGLLEALETHNRAILLPAGIDPAKVVALVAFRVSGGMGPILVAIPKRKLEPPRSLRG